MVFSAGKRKLGTPFSVPSFRNFSECFVSCWPTNEIVSSKISRSLDRLQPSNLCRSNLLRPTGPDRVGNVLARGESAGFYDFAGADATGTNVDSLWRAFDNCADSLNVWTPATLGTDVRMAHTHAERRLLATNFTNCCHSKHLENWAHLGRQRTG
jgi:hypothetical protein